MSARLKIKHDKDYREARAAEYPPLTDFADAMFHAKNGNPKPLDDYFERVKEVKNRYPKGENNGAN